MASTGYVVVPCGGLDSGARHPRHRATSSWPTRPRGSTSPTESGSGRGFLNRPALALTLLLAGAGCGSSGTPEDQIRELVADAETAAEARDASELRGLVADDYQDTSGRDASDVRNLLHAWLVAHPSVNLLTRIDSIELEGTELARVKVTVGMLGREAKGGSDWNLAADVQRLDIRLARGGWRLARDRRFAPGRPLVGVFRLHGVPALAEGLDRFVADRRVPRARAAAAKAGTRGSG